MREFRVFLRADGKYVLKEKAKKKWETICRSYQGYGGEIEYDYWNSLEDIDEWLDRLKPKELTFIKDVTI